MISNPTQTKDVKRANVVSHDINAIFIWNALCEGFAMRVPHAFSRKHFYKYYCLIHEKIMWNKFACIW